MLQRKHKRIKDDHNHCEHLEISVQNYLFHFFSDCDPTFALQIWACLVLLDELVVPFWRLLFAWQIYDAIVFDKWDFCLLFGYFAGLVEIVELDGSH